MVEFFLILTCAGVLLLIFMYTEAFRNKVVEHGLSYADYPNSVGELKVFFISDIHRRLIDRSIIERVKGQADIVVIGGDLTEKGVPFSRIRENLHRLNEIGPIFFIWGNNDFEVNLSHFRQLLLENHVKILENSHVSIPVGNDKLVYLVGVNEFSFELDDHDRALEGIPADAFKIMVCHNPKIFEKITNDDKISLTLAGHTHGGQINFFGIGLQPLGKLYHDTKGDLLISNGYGTTQLPLRLCARAQTHLLTIKRK